MDNKKTEKKRNVAPDQNSHQGQVHTERFTCSSCGGTMQYDIGKEKFVCTSCGNEGEIEVLSQQIREHDFSKYQERERNSIPFSGMSSVSCESCGAEIIFEPQDTALICPMCGSSHVATEKQRSGIPPEGIIPFKIDSYEAQQLFHKWVKSLWFAPNALKKQYQEGNLTGVYIPFWTFDADAVGRYTGRGGRVRVVNRGNGQKSTTIDWFPVSGVVSASFDDIQICASQREGANIIQKIEPFNTIHQLKPYSPAYLSGYKAEHYTIRADEGFEEAKKQIYETLRTQAQQQILMRGFQRAQVLSVNMTCSNVTYKHVLLPVYTSFFGYHSKRYAYAINGETGRVKGDRPYSPVKITIAVLVALIIVGIIYILVMQSGEGNASQGYSSFGLILQSLFFWI